MCSAWEGFDDADVAARRAHAGRIGAIADLLATYPEPTLTSMISSRSQVSYRTARRWVREASDLRSLPDLADASARGAVSTDQVDALRTLAEPGTDGAWVEALAADTGDFRIERLERMARRAVAARLERHDGGRYLTMSVTRDERFVRGRFQLHPEEAAALEQQLDARVPDGTPLADWSRAHADALMRLVADARAGDGKTTTTVVVRADAGTLVGANDAPGELANGNFVPATVVRKLAEAGRVLKIDRPTVDRETDTIPTAVRRWVFHRDEGRCRAPGCPTPRHDLEIHHVVPRSRGGAHEVSNLMLLCVACHQIRVHRHGWRVEGDAEGDLTWIWPDGTVDGPCPTKPRARAPT